jgi:hypothetical protein
MILGIDPKVDYAFKKLFGSEGNTDLRIDLLHAVLQPPPGRLITAVELLNPFSERETLDDKLSILDVKARPGTAAVPRRVADAPRLVLSQPCRLLLGQVPPAANARGKLRPDTSPDDIDLFCR